VSAPLYLECPPRTALRDYVQCLWTFEADVDEAPQPIAPDGRCELIVHLLRSYEEVRDGARVAQPPVLFAGQITKPLTLAARGAVSVLGVRFRPDGARAFLGFDLDAATDKRIDLAAEHGAVVTQLRHAIVEAESRIERRVAAVEDYVVARIVASKRAIDPVVRAAVTKLLAGEEPGAPDGLSERQFQRRFKAEVGVSPRELQSVLRFRRVFDAIDAPGPSGWVEAALAAGYFDQPQMARDFRRYLGVSSRQWAMQRAGLAKALTTRMSETYK
jgi:hypothetical protein